MLIKLRGGEAPKWRRRPPASSALLSPRGALKSKQLYPGFLRGVREKCAVFFSSAASPSRPPLSSCAEKNGGILFDYLCLSLSTPPLSRRGLLLFDGLHKSWTNAPSVLMLSKSLEVALLSEPPPLSLCSELWERGRNRIQIKMRERETQREQEKRASSQPEFSPRLPPSPPAVFLFIIIVIRGERRRGTDELGLWEELPVVW